MPENKQMYSPSDVFWSGYAGETQNGLDFLASVAQEMPYTFADFGDTLPKRVDPRINPKFIKGWMRVENQGGVGACFPAGTQVSMHDGSLKAIEDVAFGDLVLSHSRTPRRVIDTMRRYYDGDMYTLHVKGWEPVELTADHVVLVKRTGNVQWVEAREVTTDDLMLVSSGVESAASTTITVSDYVEQGQLYLVDGRLRTNSCQNSMPSELELNELTCWAMGLYAAEGSVSGSAAGTPCRATWTLHEDEQEYVSKLVQWAEQLEVPVSVQERVGTKAISVRLGCGVLADFLQTVCGKHCNHKRVPEFILRGSEMQRKAFLQGYYDGDGSYAKAGRELDYGSNGGVAVCRQIHAATASKVLVTQVSQLLVSLGMKPGRSVTKARKHQNFDSHQVYLYSDDVAQFCEVPEPERPTRRQLDNCEWGQWRKVRSVSSTPVQGFPVYDFTVDEDHSFIAEGLAVHNCQGYSLSHCVEYLYTVLTGEIVQLSPMFAYLMSQYFDGIRGDRGSTLSGGTKVLRELGLPLLSTYSAERRYPSGGYKAIPRDVIDAAKAAPYYMDKVVKFRDAKEYRAFVGSFAGIAQTGTRWTSGMARPGSHGVIRSIGGASFGGHAWNFCGYCPIDELPREIRGYVPGTRSDLINIATNSHSRNWGQQGFGYFTDELFNELNSRDLILGRTDMPNVKPRDAKTDFTTFDNSLFSPGRFL